MVRPSSPIEPSVSAPPKALLERRAEADRLTSDVARLEAEAGALAAAAAAASNAATSAREAERRRDEEADASAARRRAEDAERIAVRDHEANMREGGLAPGPGRATRGGGRQGTRLARGS